MKVTKKITETRQGNGAYLMDYRKDAYKVHGNTTAEQLQNAVREFFKTQPKSVSSNTTTAEPK